VSELDLRMYLAILKLLKFGADVTPKLISEIGDIPLSSVYHKIRNYYLVEIKLKEKKNGRKKSSNTRGV
jgi:hypothetical protein